MKSSFFKYYNNNVYELPYFGYKIHISATFSNYLDILKIVQPYLNANNISYKVIDQKEDVFYNFSVQEDMFESGKYITIYPQNQQHFLQILDELYSLIPLNMEGIYIMSDRAYKNSNNIFYRYGTIKYDLKQTENGTPVILGPNNDKFYDQPRNYFQLPSWISDIQSDNLIEESYLADNYQIYEIVANNNGGNIYRGKHKLSNKPIIMKESRPHILFDNDNSKKDLRENEFLMTKSINKYVAKPIEKVEEWINTYYIYQNISGKNLYEYSNQFNLFSFDHNPQLNLVKFQHFMQIIEKVANLIAYFHDQNIIINDLHPNNLIIDVHNDIYLIDLEHCYNQNSSHKCKLSHDIALASWNQLAGKEADCHKFANLILYLFAKLHIKENEIFDQRILNNLLNNYGINSNLNILITYLFSPEANIQQAIKIFKQIKSQVIKKNYHLNMQQTKCKQETCQNNIIEYIQETNNNFNEFIKHQDDFNYQQKLVDATSKLGLDGLMGTLVLLAKQKEDFSNIIEYGINKIQEKLVLIESRKFIPISNKNASPYINNGNAGVIWGLLIIDPIQYEELIIELADGLDCEFAQFPNYFTGMLGIADTLLEVYNFYQKEEYLYYSQKLLLNTSFYVETKKVPLFDFIKVINKLRRIVNESTQNHF